MDTSLLLRASDFSGVHSALIFRLALEREEIRMKPEKMLLYYEECVMGNCYPKALEEMCLDILAGKVQIKAVKK